MLVASCSISKRPNNRNPNFQYCKKFYVQLCWSFSCISSTSVPGHHGCSSESYLSEDSKVDLSPNESSLSLSDAKIKVARASLAEYLCATDTIVFSKFFERHFMIGKTARTYQKPYLC